MSSDDEQYEDTLSHTDSPTRYRDNLGAFGGFEPTTRLHYLVNSDLDGEVELIPQIDSQSQVEDVEDLLNRSIVEAGETWQDLGYIADRLGNLSPLLADENSELEIAQFISDTGATSQAGTEVNRRSLVGERLVFFDNMSFTIVTTTGTTSTMSTSSASTSSSSVVTTTQSLHAPIVSSGASLLNPFYPNLLRPPSAAAPLQAGEMEETMVRLEFESKFIFKELSKDHPGLLADIRDEGNDEFTRILKKATVLVDMKQLEQKCEQYEYILTYICATVDEERRLEVKRNIKATLSLINMMKVAASDEGVQGAQAVQQPAQVPPQPVHHFKAAKIHPLDLPRFNRDISRYKTFKVNFDSLIRCTGLPEELWGPYLFEALDEDTKLYAGLSESWQGRYEELWEHLDSRFANRWTVAAETLKATIMSTPPEENNWETMVHYIDDQLDRMKSLKALELTNDQLATNVLLMKLPEEFSNAIRNGIRIARKGKGKQDYKFTPEEFRDVMNDTVMSWKTTSPHLVGSTTVLHSTTLPDPQKKTSGTIQKQHGGRGGGYSRTPGIPKCYLCGENHRAMECQTYLGSNTRRKRLVEVHRCPDCTRKHKGDCEILYKCRICNGGIHFDYLCPTTEPATQK